jgi:hypothetical protein
VQALGPPLWVSMGLNSPQIAASSLGAAAHAGWHSPRPWATVPDATRRR